VASALTVSGQEQSSKDRKKIEGSGNVITKDVSVSAFSELDISGVFNVMLIQGSQEGVKIEAEDNLQDLFEVKNDGSRLKISMKKHIEIKNKKKMTVFVSFKDLKNIDLKTVGNISCEKNLTFSDLKIENKSVGNVDLLLTANSLTIENKSVGNITLKGKADKSVITNNSVGNFEASQFLVQNMEINNDGIGSVNINAAKELKVKDSFLGKVVNKGAATPKKSGKQVI
jgi:hypothetical protein